MISFQNAHPKIVQQTFQFNQVKAIKACQDVSVVFSFQKVVSKQDTLEIQLQALVSAISTICEIVGLATQLLDILDDELKFSKLISFHWKTLT